MKRQPGIAVCGVLVYALCGVALGCADSADDDATPKSEDNHHPADPHADEPKDLYVDLDGDGEAELLSPEVKDRRVEYVFGLEELQRREEEEHHDHPDGEDDPGEPPPVAYDDELIVDIPAAVIPAGADTENCVTGTWTGPDMGILNSHFVTDMATHHHLLLYELPDDWKVDVPDGKVFPCDFIKDGDHVVAPLYTFSQSASEQGIGGRLRHGQRYYMELHTVNTFPHPILVNAAYRFQLMSIDKLKGISAAFKLGPNEIQVQPGDYHIKSTYKWTKDTVILRLRGHMHERGNWFAVDWTSSNGTERLIEVPNWTYDHVAGNPPGYDYDVGEFKVSEGDTFTTHCKWHNPTNTVITTPEEMCNTFGAALMDEPMHETSPFEVVK